MPTANLDTAETFHRRSCQVHVAQVLSTGKLKMAITNPKKATYIAVHDVSSIFQLYPEAITQELDLAHRVLRLNHDGLPTGEHHQNTTPCLDEL